jgi:hypothetical protein
MYDGTYFHTNTCKVEKEELAALLEEDKQKEILRRLPLYSSKITGYRFLCSKCYECQSAIGNGVLLTQEMTFIYKLGRMGHQFLLFP